ncbi:hypothetical protein [Lysobacter gummosus]|uniref:hypothetical protein n=1 Tax=Lysobacter gummosus TaxID=262324 RepID=UPI00363C42D4
MCHAPTLAPARSRPARPGCDRGLDIRAVPARSRLGHARAPAPPRSGLFPEPATARIHGPARPAHAVRTDPERCPSG